MVAINAEKLDYTDQHGSPFEIEAAKMVVAQPLFGRIANQQGLFSVHSKPDESLHLETKGIVPEWRDSFIKQANAIHIGVDHSFCDAGFRRIGTEVAVVLRIRPDLKSLILRRLANLWAHLPERLHHTGPIMERFLPRQLWRVLSGSVGSCGRWLDRGPALC